MPAHFSKIQSQIMDAHGPPTFGDQFPLPPLPPHSPPRPYTHLTSSPFPPKSPVRRKPLPSGSSSVYSVDGNQASHQSPRQQEPSKKSPTTNTGSLESSPPLDQDGFVIRDLDRYGTNQAPWHVPKASSSDIYFTLQISSRRLSKPCAEPLACRLAW